MCRLPRRSADERCPIRSRPVSPHDLFVGTRMKPGAFLFLLLMFACCQCSSGGTHADPDDAAHSSTLQFVQLSDIHVGKSPQQEENLRHAVAQINQTDVDFILLTGDLTDHGRIEEYATLKDVLSGLSKDYYCVPGDNDILDGEGDLDRYRNELGPESYAFDHEGYRFIGINNVLQLSLDEDQRTWMEGELDGDRFGIVFAHKPLLDKNLEFQPLRLAEPLLKLLLSHSVLLYMNGDAHESAEVSVDGTHHVWCDNLSFLHTGVETYNLYKMGPDRVRLYHIHFDGTQEFIRDFPTQR